MKVIVIVGITGNQGSSVANVFLQEPGWRVRGISRDPSKESCKVFELQGVEMVKADLNDPSSLLHAFEGAHTIFGVTNFWQPVLGLDNSAPLPTGKPLNEACYDLEVQQGKNLAVAADKIPTLERYVFSSVVNATKWSGGKYTKVYHYDAKDAIVKHIQENLPGLAKKMSLVNIGLYNTNWKTYPFLAPRKQPDGTFLLSLAANPDTLIPMIDPRADTGYLVRALLQIPPGKTVLGFGSMISFNDYMKVWGEILGYPGSRYEQISIEAAAKLALGDGSFGYEIAEGFAFMGEFGFDGGDPSIVHPKDLGVVCPTTSIEMYIRGEDWSSIL